MYILCCVSEASVDRYNKCNHLCDFSFAVVLAASPLFLKDYFGKHPQLDPSTLIVKLHDLRKHTNEAL